MREFLFIVNNYIDRFFINLCFRGDMNVKDIIEKAITSLKEIQMVSKNTLKTLNKIRATIEKGDYSKINSTNGITNARTPVEMTAIINKL